MVSVLGLGLRIHDQILPQFRQKLQYLRKPSQFGSRSKTTEVIRINKVTLTQGHVGANRESPTGKRLVYREWRRRLAMYGGIYLSISKHKNYHKAD